MKKIIFLFLVVLCTLTIDNCYAQWQQDVRLTNDPAVSTTTDMWCVAAIGDVVHAVWYDNRDGNNEIYYKRSTDAGISWGADIRLTNNSATSWMPAVAVSGQFVHVVWQDSRDGNSEVYYKRSTNAGLSWEPDIRLTNNSALSSDASIGVNGSSVHVVWYDSRDGNFEIYYKRSTDGGSSWGDDARLTNSAGSSGSPSVSVSGQDVHIVWDDDRDGNFEIYYKHSTDGGTSWDADARLTNNSASSSHPSLSISAQVVHVVWDDIRDGNREIYYKRSTDGGTSWEADTRLTIYPATSQYPSAAVSGSFVHVAWFDNRDGNYEIYYKRSINAGSNWGEDTRLTDNTANSQYPSLSVSGLAVHVIWNDNRDGNYEIYYKRDTTGNIVGIKQINLGTPETFSLSQNYPNPFNPVTKIKFNVPSVGQTFLSIFDLLGREVTTLVNEQLNPGTYEVNWDGSGSASGVYYYTLQTQEFTQTRKMIFVK